MTKQKSFNLMERYQKNNDVAVQTRKQIEGLKLQLNPIHYSIMYEYFINIDPAFNKRIEESLETQTYDDETAEILYTELISQFINLKIPTAEVGELLSSLILELNTWNESSQYKQAVITEEVDFIVKQNLPDKVIKRIEAVVIPTLQDFFKDADMLQKCVIESEAEIKQLKEERLQANNLARTDELTGIPNRRGFNSFIEHVSEEAIETQSSFALIIFDLDFFKTINDTYGHLIGDSTLRYVVKLLASETKGRDYIARIGGEEFAVVLPNTDYSAALKVANNIRHEISVKKLKVKSHKQPLQVSVSGGVAMYQMNENLESFVHRADSALYHAKNHGRNRFTGEDAL
jgi:diguanylate cyclase